MLSVCMALLQAPVILSQVDLEGKVSEVLAAVEKDRQATGSIESVPKVVLVSFRAGTMLAGVLHSALSLQQGMLLCIASVRAIVDEQPCACLHFRESVHRRLLMWEVSSAQLCLCADGCREGQDIAAA